MRSSLKGCNLKRLVKIFACTIKYFVCLREYLKTRSYATL